MISYMSQNFQKGSVLKLIWYASLADMMFLIKTEDLLDTGFEPI